jgi:hypothetical protein
MVDPFEAYNLFVYDSVLILDVSATRAQLLPGAAYCEQPSDKPLLAAAAEARMDVLERCTPDDASTCLILFANGERVRAETVSAWLLDGLCRCVLCVDRTAMVAKYGFLFAPSMALTTAYPNEISVGLYLGSAASANKVALDSLQITHVVSVVERNLEPPAGRKHLLCQIPDSDEADIGSVISLALPFISEAVQGGGRVLVHCERGASRSVSVVLAHLLSVDRTLKLVEALDFVKSQRPCAQPNAGCLRHLEETCKESPRS